MRKLKKMPAAMIIAAVLCAAVQCTDDAGKTADKAGSSKPHIVDEIRAIVSENYYDRSKLPDILADLDAIERGKSPDEIRDDIRRILDGLNVSHAGLYTIDDIEFYEMLDVFSVLHTDRLNAMFPPDGVVRYSGVGIAPRLVDGRYHVGFIYANTPASRADIRIGDELLTVDGQEYSPVKAFAGKAGQTVKLSLRRERGGDPIEMDIAVELFNPTETFVTSTAASSRVIERGGRKFGYIRLYSYTRGEIGKILAEKLTVDFADVDALILDLRGRLGGAPLDAAEMFVGGAPHVESVAHTGVVTPTQVRWKKPLVGVIGYETRSGMEILAYSLKKNGVPLVGANTRGAVLGGAIYMLGDGSMLFLPGIDARLDGQSIEGVGVAPTVPVEAVLEYGQGRDPALEAAVSQWNPH